MAMPIKSTHQHGRLILLAAFPGLAGIAVLSLSLLGSAAPNHTPPPFEDSKRGGAAFSARDQPRSGIAGNLDGRATDRGADYAS
jgi:hypothetical protein